MLISVVIPAFDEEAYLGRTLESVNVAAALLREREGAGCEVVVVDNDSKDSTADVARAFGARVLKEAVHNIARVRNVGAASAAGDVLVFVDADTVIPSELLWRVARVMSDAACFGGAVDADYGPSKLAARVYLSAWRVAGRLAGLAQGATQFCRREAFDALGGYDETLYMGEDVDFYLRLKRLARRRGGRVRLIDEVRVATSARRFDRWSLTYTLVWTNPFFVLLFRRRRSFWRGWYEEVPR